MHLLLTTHKWVPWVKHCYLITFFVLFQLVGYIFFYCFCVFSHGIHLISLTPKLAVSVGKLHITPLLKNQKFAFSFEIPHKSRNAHFRRDTYQHMYMVWAYLTLYYFYAFPLAEFPKYLPYLQPFLFEKHLAPILWRKDNVVLAIQKNCVLKY